MGKNKNTLLKIAIVGRPNVGKSSLFNRMLGSRKAIVESASGTTRDRIYSDIKWKGKHFTLIDTGGFDAVKKDDITSLTIKHLKIAVEESDVILFVTDVTSGVLAQDIEMASWLRKSGKKVYLLVNKVDDDSRSANTLEFFSLGLSEPHSVSAVSGKGIDRLLDEVSASVEKSQALGGEETVKIAIVGRPNVGKSSYLNAILNEERAIVHHVAGTTRDALDTDFEYKGRQYRLIDTAGMRHNMKLESSADFYGSVRSKEAIKRSDVAMVLIDGLEGLKEDDGRVIDFCMKEGKAVIVVINKWDLVKGLDTIKYKEMLVKKMNVVKNLPVVFISCKAKKNILPPLDLVMPLVENIRKDLGSEDLKILLENLNNSHEIRNRRLRFEYLKQKSVKPPKFVLGMKNPRLSNDNLKRYVENFLRASRDFKGLPVSVAFEKRPTPKRTGA